ncbi:hypothetical protein [Variovorax saccharolyticus]|uniref:hypothetical protein n=1 Tax=Variovorax saccharolyticus TaxID=3053516 RepID=UPI002577F0B6|nr:hypothetical protein [Variovorax sp. J31P216]
MGLGSSCGQKEVGRAARGGARRSHPRESGFAALVDWRAERLASWFEAKSSSLSGQRPRELIATNPQLEVDAAKCVVMAEAFNARAKAVLDADIDLAPVNVRGLGTAVGWRIYPKAGR